jgi:hypothetical protein
MKDFLIFAEVQSCFFFTFPLFERMFFVTLLAAAAALPVVQGVDWCFCTLESDDVPLVAWEYNTTEGCSACVFQGNKTVVGCTNFTTHAAAALPMWSVSSYVGCSAPLASWSDVTSIASEVNGVSALCNQTTCCCPTGSFQLSNVNANSMHLKTGLAGQCNNKTSFDADVALNQLAHTFLEVKQGAWPFSGNYLHITTSMMGMLNADKGCAFYVTTGGGISGGGIAAIVIVVIVVLLGGVSFCLWRRRRGASTYQTI